jgi:hypothetical protein
MSIKGTMAVISGDTSGIGEECVRLFAERGGPRDLTRAMAFLASDETRFMNGTLLPVDGDPRVRMGGLSAYIIAMSPVQQDNIIRRFNRGSL